jgi:DNA-binding NtrC family response regulator
LLVDHFLARYNSKSVAAPVVIPDETLVHLWEYDWPGNVRELENVVERVATLVDGDQVTVEDLPLEVRTYVAERRRPRPSADDSAIDLFTAVERFEHSLIEQALQRTRGNKQRAATLLGLKRTTLVAKLRRRTLPHEIDVAYEDPEPRAHRHARPSAGPSRMAVAVP